MRVPFCAHLTVPNIMVYNALYILSRPSEFYKEVVSEDGRQGHNGHMPQRRENYDPLQLLHQPLLTCKWKPLNC